MSTEVLMNADAVLGFLSLHSSIRDFRRKRISNSQKLRKQQVPSIMASPIEEGYREERK